MLDPALAHLNPDSIAAAPNAHTMVRRLPHDVSTLITNPAARRAPAQ